MWMVDLPTSLKSIGETGDSLGAMIELPRDATGHAACGYSGRPLLAHCACGRRRLIPFRLLKTDFGDTTPIYGRPFRCKACQRSDITLFVFDDQAEFDRMRAELLRPSGPLKWHSTPSRTAPAPDPYL